MAQEFDDLMELQEIYLAQQISKELQARNLTDQDLSEKIIKLCKESFSQQNFIEKIEQNSITLSRQFIISLYQTIRQKLSIKFDDLITKQDKILEEQGLQAPNLSKQRESLQRQIHQIPEQVKKTNNFPGLSLPNYDEIQLQLDLSGQQHPNQQVIKDQSPKIKKNQEQVQKHQKKIEIKKISSRSSSRERSRKKKTHKHRHQDLSLSQSDSQRRHKKRHRKNSVSQRQSSQQRYRKEQSKYDKHRKRDKGQHGDNKYQKRDIRQYDYNKSNQYDNRSWHQNKNPQNTGKKMQNFRKIQENQVYRGNIKRIDKMGCVIQLFNVDKPEKMAVVHHSQIRQGFTGSPTQILSQGQKVWVKVITILDDRIRLSMKDINQYNGYDKNQPKPVIKQTLQRKSKNQQSQEKLTGNLTGIKISQQDEVDQEGNATSYAQLWQLNRLGYMGKNVKKQPAFKQDIEQINIQMNQRQPPFLTGQTTKAGINLSPVRVVKNPQGTLHRQALNAAQNAKQRREIRQQNKNQVRDLNKILQEVIPDRDNYRKATKRNMMSIKQQRESLPVFAYKQPLIKACEGNKILIVIGQTGSGKTTQITQYLHQAGFSKRGKIGCTQPRRVAAMSVAKRVAEEMNVKLGQQVGYSIRFQDYTSSKTIIKYMTDGMLLRQALIDKYLGNYSVIMLDQAHERTIHTDVLFGILKKVVQKRKDFTLIVTSATLQATKFSSYFFDCKIFSIPGRTYNVEILYAKEPETDYLDAALMCVLQIHIDQPVGDVLLFLTGQQQIDTACQVLNERIKKMGSQIPQLIVLPVYSALPSELQSKIFDPAPRGKRKCVIATNIAQASLTIDGIFYVVDPGFSKIKIFNSKIGMDTLVVAPISQASSKQRAGRAGRTGPGKCYRLYTQDAYKNEMLPTSVPQIQRANLSNTVLQLKAMGINDLINFDFMDAPPVQTLIAALEQLYYLSALDDEGLLTKLGRKMAQFPLQPPLSKMLLTSIDFGCTQQIATIISLLSVQNIFYRPKQKQTIADQKKTKFNHHQGDHLTYLAVFQAWKNSGYSASWCHQNYIQQRSLKRAQDVKKQIVQLLQRYKFKINSCNGNFALIRKTIVSGFFFHAAKKDPKGGYKTLVDDHQVYIHPSSSLFNKQPQWVIYHQLIFTSKQYMRDVCAINPKWLIDVAPNFFKFTDQLGFTRKKRNQRIDPLNQKYGDPNAWRLSKRKG